MSAYAGTGIDTLTWRQAPARGAPCGAIAEPPSAMVRDDGLLGECIDLLIERRLAAVPVIGAEERYLGSCTIRAIFDRCLVVPFETMSRMASTAFIADGIAEISSRLRPLRGAPVRDFIDHGIRAIRPGDHPTLALALLGAGAPIVPVVDERHGRLTGLVTWPGALAALDAECRRPTLRN